VLNVIIFYIHPFKIAPASGHYRRSVGIAVDGFVNAINQPFVNTPCPFTI
jgi:hypothetical protein